MGDTEKDKRDEEALHFVMHNTAEIVARQMSKDMGKITELKQQRDELLAALKEVTECLDAQITGKGGFAIEEVLQDARAAISKCEA